LFCDVIFLENFAFGIIVNFHNVIVEYASHNCGRCAL
jgi:hypothetical protein